MQSLTVRWWQVLSLTYLSASRRYLRESNSSRTLTFSYKEWLSSPGLVVSIDLTSLSGIGKGSSVNESLYYIPLLLPLCFVGLVPFFVSVFVAKLRSKGALGKSPTGLDRPTAEMPLLGSALRGSSLLTSFSEALVKALVCGLRWV